MIPAQTIETADKQKEILVSALRMMLNGARTYMENFIGKLENSVDWSFDLAWGDKAFEKSADAFVAAKYLNRLNQGATLEDMLKNIQSMVNSMSKIVPSSTSVCSNLIDNHKRRAYADVLQMVLDIKEMVK